MNKLFLYETAEGNTGFVLPELEKYFHKKTTKEGFFEFNASEIKNLRDMPLQELENRIKKLLEDIDEEE